MQDAVDHVSVADDDMALVVEPRLGREGAGLVAVVMIAWSVEVVQDPVLNLLGHVF